MEYVRLKRCCNCKIEKPFEEFCKNKNTKDGYSNECRGCNKMRYEQNKDKIKEQEKEYREQNKEKIKERKKEYYEENKDKIKERNKEYREQNKDKIADQQKEYRGQNKDKIREYHKEHYQKNKHKYISRKAKRRAQKLKATPPWLTPEYLEEITEFYTICKLFQTYTGLTYHVDHIVPLQGKTVCGLHVPWNLQVLEASENISKNNKLLEEFENES